MLPVDITAAWKLVGLLRTILDRNIGTFVLHTAILHELPSYFCRALYWPPKTTSSRNLRSVHKNDARYLFLEPGLSLVEVLLRFLHLLLGVRCRNTLNLTISTVSVWEITRIGLRCYLATSGSGSGHSGHWMHMSCFERCGMHRCRLPCVFHVYRLVLLCEFWCCLFEVVVCSVHFYPLKLLPCWIDFESQREYRW